jgi:hypothetical protein
MPRWINSPPDVHRRIMMVGIGACLGGGAALGSSVGAELVRRQPGRPLARGHHVSARATATTTVLDAVGFAALFMA